MAKTPWFKLFASDLLLDEKLVSFSPGEMGLLLKMWCVIWLHGKISSDPKEISLRTGYPLSDVQMYLQKVLQTLNRDADGFLYSERMDRQRERIEKISFIRREAVSKRQDRQNKEVSTNVVTKPVTKDEQVCKPICTGDSDSDSDIKTYSSEPKVSEPSVIEIPLNDNTTYGVSSKEVKVWTQLYPSVDVMQQLRNMIGWSMGNPSRRKTRRGIQRFITSWLARAQDTGKSFTPPADQFNLTGGLDQVMANRRANGFH